MHKVFIPILLIFVFSSCRKDEVKVGDILKEQFIVVGHAYGHPTQYSLRLHHKLIPALANAVEFIRPEKFIFTGDVVAKPTAENWNNVLHELDSLGIDNYWIAPGNHDLGSSYFSDNIQPKAYFSERIGNNLFMVLNTNFKGWTVDEAQINMIADELSNLSEIDNVLVFSHQVWWAKDLNAVYEFDTIVTNSNYLKSGSNSFWSDAFPMFQTTDKPTYFFAGDVGAWHFIPAYVVNQFDNFHFYASGIGGGKEDNMLNIKTFESGNIQIDRIDF